ncbi:MAG: ATP-binding protein [bacterium]|nr:ATP-binding protein [bacterium]
MLSHWLEHVDRGAVDTDSLRELATALASATGPEFYRGLARFLGAATGAEFVFVGRLVRGPVERIATRAFLVRGELAENITYELAGTPCQNVVGLRFCCHPEGVQELFPEDAMLVEHGIESYLGMPLIGRSGRALGLIGLMRTQPVTNAEHLRVLMQLVADRCVSEFEREDLEAQVRSARQFESLAAMAAGLSHDLNNLMTAILGNASLAANHLPERSPMRPLLDEIEQAARGAAGLTRRLLSCAENRAVNLRPMCLAELVRASARVFCAATRGVGFRLELDPVTIEGDSAHLRDVLMSLLLNAAEACGVPVDGGRRLGSGSRGTIAVRTGIRTLRADPDLDPDASAATNVSAGSVPVRRREWATLEIEDDGCGMDGATTERIFEPFFTTGIVGRGLGLPAALATVRAHGGMIHVDSAPGRGTRMTILLPLVL